MTDLATNADPFMEIAVEAEEAPEPPSKRKKLSIGMWLGIAWLVFIAFSGFFASWLPYMRSETQRLDGGGNFGIGPGADAWFGTDQLGRDVFARCMYGARLALTVSVASIGVALIIGGALGLIAGYFKGWVDRIISILIDSLLAFPAIVIAALFIGRFDALQSSDIEFLGFGFDWLTRAWGVTIVFAFLSVAPLARIVRAQALSMSQREYVLAARSLGASTPRILLREILPNLVPAMMAVMFTGVAILLAAEGGLAFIGYSVKPPRASWGLMIAEGRTQIRTGWWATIFPAFMLFATVLSFNLIGDRLARRFDIREAAL